MRGTLLDYVLLQNSKIHNCEPVMYILYRHKVVYTTHSRAFETVEGLYYSMYTYVAAVCLHKTYIKPCESSAVNDKRL